MFVENVFLIFFFFFDFFATSGSMIRLGSRDPLLCLPFSTAVHRILLSILLQIWEEKSSGKKKGLGKTKKFREAVKKNHSKSSDPPFRPFPGFEIEFKVHFDIFEENATTYLVFGDPTSSHHLFILFAKLKKSSLSGCSSSTSPQERNKVSLEFAIFSF